MAKKLTIQQVQHIADLARIGLSDDETGKLQEDLGAVLDYVEKLDKVDVSGVKPTAHISGLENETREDENGSTHSYAKTLTDMAPEVKGGYVEVKKIL